LDSVVSGEAISRNGGFSGVLSVDKQLKVELWIVEKPFAEMVGSPEPYRRISTGMTILLIVEELLPIRDSGTFGALS
jgi:hypothetical protein